MFKLITLAFPFFMGFSAMAVVCETSLNPRPPEGIYFQNRLVRVLLGNNHEINLNLGIYKEVDILSDTYLVVGSTSPRPDATDLARSSTDVLERVEFSRVRISPKKMRITLSGDDNADVSAIIELNQPLTDTTFDIKSFQLFNGDDQALSPTLKRIANQRHKTVLLDQVPIKIYSGSAAAEIMQLLQQTNHTGDESPYYRGLHLFNTAPYASVYLKTNVEAAHLARGLSGLGLRPDHPIFEDLK